MEKHLLSGNEAIARGAYEAGVKVCSAYPGTPSTEIFESLPQYGGALYCEWAPNEKVATEVAYGASIGGVRSLCAMKHVGLNVAADPLFTAAYNGVGGGFVIVTADDPSMHSSQNEQDNRNYARSAKVALVEPAPYVRNQPKFNCSPANAYRNHPKVEKNLRALEEYGESCPINKLELNGSRVGVVTASIAYQYAKDVFPEDTSFLKLGLTNPLPMKLIRDFAAKVEKLYVIEELDGFMEEQIKAAGIPCVGKELVSNLYELNPERLREMIFGVKPVTKELAVKAVPRPPVLCPGCPHRGFFYTMSKGRDFVIAGDIGCYTLGGAAPLDAMDTCVCMGGGFSIAMGMSKAFEAKGEQKKIFGVVGDSTFFHSGMTGAAEILYNKGRVIPVVLDNHITGMTGHQDNPGSGYTLQGEVAAAIRIEDVLRSFGYENVMIVDPQDLAAMQKAVDDALASETPAAIICRRPCLLIKRIRHEKGLCVVDRDKCIGCKKCLKVGCPAVMIKDRKSSIDPNQCVGCTLCAQVCPVGAISRKEGK